MEWKQVVEKIKPYMQKMEERGGKKIYILIFLNVMTILILFDALKKGKTEWGVSADLYALQVVEGVLTTAMLILAYLDSRATRIISCIWLILWLFCVKWRYAAGNMVNFEHAAVAVLLGIMIFLVFFFLGPPVFKRRK